MSLLALKYLYLYINISLFLITITSHPNLSHFKQSQTHKYFPKLTSRVLLFVLVIGAFICTNINGRNFGTEKGSFENEKSLFHRPGFGGDGGRRFGGGGGLGGGDD